MSLCYDFQKWTMITCAAILAVLVIGFIIMVVDVYGQLSPDELKSQADRQQVLRSQYLDYLIQHNVTVEYNNSMTIYDLERNVKQHIEECASGEHDKLIEDLKEYDKKDYNGKLYAYDGQGLMYGLEDLGHC
jgi:hypothetical protein